jgi:hypothetical protein
LYPDGTNHVYKIEDNKLENVINYSIRFNTHHDRNFNNPIIYGKKASLYNRQGALTISTNASATNWINTTSLPYHFVSPAIKDYNRYGHEFRYNGYGRWYKDPDTGYQKFFRLPNIVNGKAPYLAAYIYVDDNVTGSFDLTFDYYVDKGRKLQYQGFESGSAYVQFTKNGAQVGDLQVLDNVESPTNFTSTYNLEGPGLYYIGLAGLDTATGYIALRNVTSRIVGPTEGMNVTSNTFNMRYFEDGDQSLLKTAYVQGEQDPKFRLQGIRIF